MEFAIVLPFLMLIVLGIIFFGRYENDSSQATSLAELGARDAAIDYGVPTSQSLAQFIALQATGELTGTSDVGAVGVTIECYTGTTPSSTCNTSPSGTTTSVSVCVQTTVQFPFLGHGSTLVQKATMRVEQSAAAQPTGDGLLTPANGGSTTTGLKSTTPFTQSYGTNAPSTC